MSESVADSLGISPSLSFRGKTYQLAERSLEMEGAVEVHLQGLAREMILAQRDRMTPLEFAEQMRGWRAEGVSAYCWDMPACQQFVQSPRGLRLLAFLQLKEGNPNEKVTERLVSDWFRDPVEGQVIAEAVLASNFPFVARAVREMMTAPSESTGITSAPPSPGNPGTIDPGKSASSADGGLPASSTTRATATAS